MWPPLLRSRQAGSGTAQKPGYDRTADGVKSALKQLGDQTDTEGDTNDGKPEAATQKATAETANVPSGAKPVPLPDARPPVNKAAREAELTAQYKKDLWRKAGIDPATLPRQPPPPLPELEKKAQAAADDAVAKKFTQDYRRQLAAEAEGLYPVLQVGSTTSVTVGGRTVSGIVRSVDDRQVRIGDVDVSRDDFRKEIPVADRPGVSRRVTVRSDVFDANVQAANRRAYVRGKFDDAKEKYAKDACLRNLRKLCTDSGYREVSGNFLSPQQLMQEIDSTAAAMARKEIERDSQNEERKRQEEANRANREQTAKSGAAAAATTANNPFSSSDNLALYLKAKLSKVYSRDGAKPFLSGTIRSGDVSVGLKDASATFRLLFGDGTVEVPEVELTFTKDFDKWTLSRVRATKSIVRSNYKGQALETERDLDRLSDCFSAGGVEAYMRYLVGDIANVDFRE